MPHLLADGAVAEAFWTCSADTLAVEIASGRRSRRRQGILNARNYGLQPTTHGPRPRNRCASTSKYELLPRPSLALGCVNCVTRPYCFCRHDPHRQLFAGRPEIGICGEAVTAGGVQLATGSMVQHLVPLTEYAPLQHISPSPVLLPEVIADKE
jgi:hypothetical protein